MFRLLPICCLLLTAKGLVAADSAPDYQATVVAYTEAMIEHGRDTYGKQQSPLFASALDRKTLRIGKFPDIEGVRNADRSLTGANPQVDAPLYAILYRLTDQTGNKRYAAEADAALAWFFAHCQSPETDLMAWGEHLFWDFEREACGMGKDAHEVTGEWPFWDACYRLAPEASWRFAIGQWDHQVADHATGDFSRHAKWTRHGPGRGADFPRYAGQMIISWADAYVRPANEERKRRDDLLTAITIVLARMEANMAASGTGHLLAGTDDNHKRITWPTSNLELARCLWKTIPLMEDALAHRMRVLALKQDEHFLSLPHEVLAGGGFAVTIDSTTGEPRKRSMNRPFTTTWASGYGHGIHAKPALKCVDRMLQLQESHPELAAGYRALVVAAADNYLDSEPDTAVLLKPQVFAQVIGLLLAVHDLTDDERYLTRADHFGRQALALFCTDGSPLPRATNQHDHYEAITGGPDLMAALLDLHVALTANRP